MGRRLALTLLGGAAGYALGGLGGGLLVEHLSSNTHDAPVEAAMTGAFVLGPLGAVVGLLVGGLFSKPARPASGRTVARSDASEP